MPEKHSWIGEQAFGEDAGALVTVAYEAHRDGLRFIKLTLNDSRGICLLEGPRASGKTTIVRRFAQKMPGDTAIAVLDGNRIKPRELLSRMLSQFGYDTGLESTDELLKMVSIFSVQQARRGVAPVLVVDNVDRMFPSALRTLSQLAEIVAGDQLFGLRMVLTGREGLKPIVNSEGMASVARRNAGSFVISPLSLREALLYLHARLGACGVNNADTVFPVDVCDRLYQQSGGWPGLMNQYAIEAIGRAKEFPLRLSDTESQDDTVIKEQLTKAGDVAEELPVLDVSDATGKAPPKFVISRNGKLVQEYAFASNKILIGRSDFADVIINDDYVSKMHAVILFFSDALVLLDLNSANGTTVNSVTVRSTILKSNDIISLGNHRLKVKNAPAISAEMKKLLENPDTLRMKSLVESRQAHARMLGLAAVGGRTTF